MYQRSPDTHNQTMPQRCLTKPHTELKHVVPKPHTTQIMRSGKFGKQKLKSLTDTVCSNNFIRSRRPVPLLAPCLVPFPPRSA